MCIGQETTKAQIIGQAEELDPIQLGVIDSTSEYGGGPAEETDEERGEVVHASINQLYGLSTSVLRAILKRILDKEYEPLLGSTKTELRATLPRLKEEQHKELAQICMQTAILMVASIDLIAESAPEAEASAAPLPPSNP